MVAPLQYDTKASDPVRIQADAPPPDRNPDYREYGDLPVPRGSSVQIAADRDLFGRPPESDAPIQEDRATRAKPVDDRVRAALRMMGADAEIGRRIGDIEAGGRAVQDSYTAQQVKVGQDLIARHEKEIAALGAIQEFRKGLAEARPEVPTLQKMPGVPDLKVRPWLDPEGKNALVVMAQGLGMLATGIAGVVLKAPNTALKQFRLAAEDWRRDEIDRANSNLNQFQATVEQIKGDNQTALQEYELADKRYSTNLVAKQAAVASRLQELNLHDQATVAASMPFELGREAAQSQLRTSSLILEQLTRWYGVAARYNKAASYKLPTTTAGALGQWLGYTQQAQATQDPEEKKQLLAHADVAKAMYTRLRKDEGDLADRKSGLTLAGKELPILDKQDQMADFFATRIPAFIRAFKPMEDAGLLPKDNSDGAKLAARIRRAIPSNWTKEADAQKGVISQLFTQMSVGEARTFMNDVMRAQGAFGEIHDYNLPYSTILGLAEQWISNIESAKRLNAAHRQRILSNLGGGLAGVSGGPESAPSEPADEGGD